jgi:hypothetical protein
MQIYITLIILLSFVHHIKMGGHAKAPATTRLRIFSRGFSLQSLPRQPAHTRTTRPRRFDTFKESHNPLMRLRFASGTSKSRVSVSTSHSEPAKIGSSVRVHINDAVSITHPFPSLVLSLTFYQGISNFELASLLVTNIWGGWMLQEPRWR